MWTLNQSLHRKVPTFSRLHVSFSNHSSNPSSAESLLVEPEVNLELTHATSPQGPACHTAVPPTCWGGAWAALPADGASLKGHSQAVTSHFRMSMSQKGQSAGQQTSRRGDLHFLVRVVFFHGGQDTQVEPSWESQLTRTALRTSVWVQSTPAHVPRRFTPTHPATLIHLAHPFDP